MCADLVDLVEWEKLTQEGKGMKVKAKPLKRLHGGHPACSGGVSRRSGRRIQRHRGRKIMVGFPLSR